MYGRCQADDRCTDPAAFLVEFGGQPADPMGVCERHVGRYEKPGNEIRRLA